MLNRTLIILAAIVTTINLSFNASAQPLMKKIFGRMYVDNISEVADKDIVRTFFKMSPSGTIEGWSPELAAKKSYLIILEKTFFCVERSVRRILYKSPDPEEVKSFYYEEDSDDIAQKYIAMAKSRNNVVRLYKPKMGAIVGKLFKKPYVSKMDKAKSLRYDRNRVLMEFDKSGKIVSVLVRAIYEPENFIYQYSVLYFGGDVDRRLVDNVNTADFQEYFIKDL